MNKFVINLVVCLISILCCKDTLKSMFLEIIVIGMVKM